jgi:hypothetical protein
VAGERVGAAAEWVDATADAGMDRRP